jgi:hypothetical protein
LALTGLLQELHEDEEASAQVEFLVLLPVYLLMIIGLFFFGNLALARVSLVSAAQVRAWDPAQRFTDQQLERSFFASNQHFGTFTTQGGGQARHRPAAAASGAIQPADLQSQGGGASGNMAALAANALNNAGSQNQNDLPFWRSEARCTFLYDGLAPNNMTIQQVTYAAVLLPRQHQRPVFTPGQAHPVVALSGSAYFDPNAQADQPLSPKFSGYFDGADGLWDIDARIRGSLNAEHSYIRGKPHVNLGIVR